MKAALGHKEVQQHPKSQQEIADIGDESPRIVVDGEDGALFVHIVGALEKSIPFVVQHMVHIDPVWKALVLVDHDHLAGVGAGAHRSWIALQLKVFEFQCKRERDALGSIGERDIQIPDPDMYRLSLDSTFSKKPHLFFPFGHLDPKDQQILVRAVFGQRIVTNDLFFGMGIEVFKDQIKSGDRVQAALLHHYWLIGRILFLVHIGHIDGFDGIWGREGEMAIFEAESDNGLIGRDIGIESDHRITDIEILSLQEALLDSPSFAA